MKVVILCGGKGVRYRNVYSDVPKPLAPVGNIPILWHLLKYFEAYGYKDFILCTGYKGIDIQNYVDTITHYNWNVECIDTGLEASTGERIKKIEHLIEEDSFIVTYVDGLSNVNIDDLVTFHNKSNKIATLTAVKPKSQYGVLALNNKEDVLRFDEKPALPFYINGGFLVFKKEVFNYIKDGDVLEDQCFKRLVEINQLKAFKHEGFWKSMDTFKENIQLNERWNNNKAPWKIWKK